MWRPTYSAFEEGGWPEAAPRDQKTDHAVTSPGIPVEALIT